MPALNQTVCALRIFYGTTLGWGEIPERIPYARSPQPLPTILSTDEVVRFLEAVSSLKCRAALTTAYAAGLRASETTHLRVGDIDSSRMLIQVHHGKGGKDRSVMLSPQLLVILCTYWRLARPPHWLFPGRDPEQPIDTTVAACRSVVKAAGLAKQVTVYTLRHSFATHLREAGTDIRIIQMLMLLGHAQLSTTARNTQVATTTIANTLRSRVIQSRAGAHGPGPDQKAVNHNLLAFDTVENGIASMRSAPNALSLVARHKRKPARQLGEASALLRNSVTELTVRAGGHVIHAIFAGSVGADKITSHLWSVVAIAVGGGARRRSGDQKRNHHRRRR